MDEDNPEKLATFVYTGYRTKTIQRNWQYLCTQDTVRRQSKETDNICVHRIQDEDNPEKLSTSKISTTQHRKLGPHEPNQV